MPIEVNLSPKKTLGYHVVRSIVWSLWTVMFRPVIEGAENIPTSGPIVIAPVHRSNVDFALAIFITPRKTFFMAKDSLWKVPVLRWMISTMGAFPVKRGTADRESLDKARSVLRDGQPLVLFPEGTRQSGPTVSELHMGAAFVALHTGAQIVPVGIAGPKKSCRRAQNSHALTASALSSVNRLRFPKRQAAYHVQIFKTRLIVYEKRCNGHKIVPTNC